MGIKINRLEYYHPDEKYSNNYFLKHFKERNVNISGLLKTTGRENRYISTNPHENSLTMAIMASIKVLEKAEISADKINMIVHVSTTPEFLSPTNALKVHKALMCNKNCILYDMNANCSGMVVAFDQISRYMKSNSKVKYALIVATDQLNRYSRESEAITYSNFGESACAMILENDEDCCSDIIDSEFYVDNTLSECINFPPRGFSKFLPNDKSVKKDDRIIEWIDFDSNDAFLSAVSSIEEVLKRNNLKREDISLYCISQFAKANIDIIRKELNEPECKFPFVGDEFGYTGVNSPFMILAKSISGQSIKRGDFVILWTCGAGVLAPCVLLKY